LALRSGLFDVLEELLALLVLIKVRMRMAMGAYIKVLESPFWNEIVCLVLCKLHLDILRLLIEPETSASGNSSTNVKPTQKRKE
jgi:hypothetical protein